MIRWHFGVSKTSSKRIILCQPHTQTVVLRVNMEAESSFLPVYKVSAGILHSKGRRIKNKRKHMRLFS